MTYRLNIQDEILMRTKKIAEYRLKILEEEGVINLLNSLLQKGITTATSVKDKI